MKKTLKFIGIIAFVAIIGFSMLACGDDNGSDYISTSGSITITNLEFYNNKYAWGVGYLGETTELTTGANFSSSKGISAGLIKNGSVTLKVWTDGLDTMPTNFNGNGAVNFSISILESSTVGGDPAPEPIGLGSCSVIFTNGTGSGVFEEHL
ncbi:MAG: hypothetical protein LBC80_06000 [Treponema sp.]|jgi:hypothetical protein|nr:hypothetical protein [Treponema sp.]